VVLIYSFLHGTGVLRRSKQGVTYDEVLVTEVLCLS
jgi:hypothetical protein